ncbi:MAG: tRNA (adenosine(37)-N6)-dimethylallyltransferase MiaA [Candidatus Sungbacteria bacterium RIFCSPLOWO2_01_FULL_47_10]|uniref:tRNA dimethylallyltransferase n=1 Tax=Candidatus Sungbacteria bacterium RIFCSPLOWO2_01_FULL_47_10 TaxID=1802276 RepID=A0A1G2L595_9BACT|nr:MAG: tRNA (adenosine(37)-N6)-dimethylallyltransferase MiaA [Candidatus Sungbacteria bacterium RIFCSPLOWO2_01_FULL_47_10]
MLSKKIIAVVGPTASGKSDLAVAIAKRFSGEIISADSRQVYRGMDIGTGKVAGEWRMQNKNDSRSPKRFIYKNIPHHCIDIASPKRIYTVADFKKCAISAMNDITNRKKVTILCGGTGFYIDAVLYNIPIPDIPPDKKLRYALSKKTSGELFAMLKKLDPGRAGTIDRKNPRRLVRAIEISRAIGTPAYQLVRTGRIRPQTGHLEPLLIGIRIPKKELYKKIDIRLEKRIRQGMIREVKKLLEKGASFKRLYALGLEYRFVSLYLAGKLTKREMTEQLKNAIHRYAKRQMAWFKRNKNIHWVSPGNGTERLVIGRVRRFLKIRLKKII